MRAVRVIRLFGRFSELKKMVSAVSASVLAMMHSFFIFILVMAICEHLITFQIENVSTARLLGQVHFK